MPLSSKDVNFALLANDITVHSTQNSVQEIYTNWLQTKSILNDWLIANKLLVNKSKTQETVFSFLN